MKRTFSILSFLGISTLAVLSSAVPARAQTVTKIATLPSGGGGQTGIATDGTNLYVDSLLTASTACDGAASPTNTTTCTTGIFVMPLAGGTPTLLYPTYQPSQIAIVGSQIFWIDPNAGPITDTEILAAPKSGAGPVGPIYVGSNVGQPIVDGFGLTTDGTKLYASDAVLGNVFSLNTDGSGLTKLNTSQHWGGFFSGEQGNGLVWNNGNLYNANTGTPSLPFPPEAVSLPATGGSFTTLASGSPFVCPLGTAVGNNTLYVSDECADTIWELPLAGGTPTALVSGSPLVAPNGVLFFNNALYILDQGNGTTIMGAVYKLAFAGPSTTTVSSSANPLEIGVSVTLTATVTPTSGTGTPTGTVTFTDTSTSTTLGTETLSSGQATLTTSSLAVGTHNITAQYSGDSNFLPSSGSLTQTVEYGLCLLYDQTMAVHSGAVIPIKLELCDVNGNDLSNSSIIVHATGVVLVSTNTPGTLESPGNANPDNDFRFDSTLGSSGGYIFNLSTGGLGREHTTCNSPRGVTRPRTRLNSRWSETAL